MYDEVTDAQKRRADNIIWNAAGSYAFRPDFKAYDKDGQADLYWNVIIGSARKHYDYKQFEELFLTIDEQCQDIFWSALEKVLYPKEKPERPVLELLREEYDSPLSFTESMTTEEIVQCARNFFHLYHQGYKPLKERNLLGIRKTKTSAYHSFLNHGTMWHTSKVYGTAQGQDPKNELVTKMTEAELRRFMETKYGKPMFSPSVSYSLEKELCRDHHENCHILFTYGERGELTEVTNGFEALARQREAKQIESNRNSYKQNLRQNRTAISKLAGNIQNSILLHLQPVPVKSGTGKLDGRRVWRAAVLEENKIFVKDEQDNLGDFSVDILLDASTSQTNRQETIAAQGYIIAESLRRCSVPCRVMSFCSMTGYTIIRVFRKNNDIFEYVSNGCNRDGLAIRAARALIREERTQHRMLIILSDVKPNDVVKIHSDRTDEMVTYDKETGLHDTAMEVRRARAEGISVICVFTGDDEDLPSTNLVYGQDFVRIKSMDCLADAVGKLIQTQIKNL